MNTAEHQTPKRFESLDLCRGAACLSIVFYHFALNYTQLAAAKLNDRWATRFFESCLHLSIGVPIFFVISGYCIIAAADKLQSRPRNHVAYFSRRFRRIFPPYWFILIFSILAVAVIDVLVSPGFLSTPPRAQLRPWWFSPTQWLGNVTLTETWRHHLFGSQRGHFIGQSWTLCYEEQFYLVIGLILMLSRTRLFLGSAIVTFVCIAIQIGANTWNWPVDGLFLDGAWLMFAAGILVYWQIAYASRLDFAISWIALLLVLFISTYYSIPLFPGTSAAFAFALVLPGLASNGVDSRLSTSPWLAPLRICGVMCYSLYLVHELVLQFVQRLLMSFGIVTPNQTLLVAMPIAIAITLSVGWSFHITVERRFLNKPLATAAPAESTLDTRERVFVPENARL